MKFIKRTLLLPLLFILTNLDNILWWVTDDRMAFQNFTFMQKLSRWYRWRK